jgi:hypothetical protein
MKIRKETPRARQSSEYRMTSHVREKLAARRQLDLVHRRKGQCVNQENRGNEMNRKKHKRKPANPKNSKIPKRAWRGALSDATVRQRLIEIAGEHAIDVLQVLAKKGPLQDNSIAARTKLRVTECRACLNKLNYPFMITSYHKEKDKESNFDIYVWQLNPNRLEMLKSQ